VTYVALHRGSNTTVSTDSVVIPASDLHILQSSLDLARLLEESMDTAQGRIEGERKSARLAGYDAGYAQGFKEGQAAFSASLAQVTQELLSARREITQSVAGLAVRIVKHIALSIGPERTVAALVDTALDECLVNAPLTIRVHPDSVVTLDAVVSRHMNELGFESQLVKIKADENLEKFECFIDSANASVVASLDVQLQRIEAALSEEAKIQGEHPTSADQKESRRSTSQSKSM
jgi:type III secretion protein L